MKNKYEIISKKCVNSYWIARFLAKEKQEYCQCMFGCKIEIKHKESGYKYVISEREYNELKNSNNI